MIACTLTCAAGIPSPGAAQGRSLRLESFHAEIIVRPDGTTLVTETLRPRFTGSWNGIYRNLSLQHRTARGAPARLDVEVLSVTDGEGNPLEVDHSSPDAWTRRLRIWVPGAEDATRTVVLRYRVDNALRFFDDEDDPGGVHDELYWNVTGNQWEIPIDRASVEITLPAAASATDVSTYTGPAGATGSDAEVRAAGARVEARTGRVLPPGDGFTISVSLPPGFVSRPAWTEDVAGTFRMWWPAGLPVLVLLVMGRLWTRYGRDPEGRPVAVQYEPPPDLTPAEAGTLVDHRAEMHDLTSTLVDLAVRGWIRIEEREEKRFFGLSRDREYVFHLMRPRSAWSTLLPHERRFLGALFRGGPNVTVTRAVDLALHPLESVELSDLENRFYKALDGIRNAIYDRLVERGHYTRRPDRVQGLFVGLAVVVAVAGGVATAVTQGAPVFLAHPTALLVGFALSAGVVLLVGLFMPARTVRGARTREAALGFREFLKRVEEPRYRRMIRSTEDFERYLPYAMAFQVEDRWARAFEDLYREPPDWYTGSTPGRGFRAGDFTSDLSSMTRSASSTFSSSPSSSGSGGGGSSGGGSGGGGGGGF